MKDVKKTAENSHSSSKHTQFGDAFYHSLVREDGPQRMTAVSCPHGFKRICRVTQLQSPKRYAFVSLRLGAKLSRLVPPLLL